ncbi:MAG: hypothetical protein SPK06_07310 [Kiritimatiellia bacterium]|nr:hypothetical protein [Kiritimatiellia bacterium]
MSRTASAVGLALLATAAIFAKPDPIFTALVLPATSGKNPGISRAYDHQIAQLGIRAVYATPEEVESGVAWEKLDSCDMLLVPTEFAGRATNGVNRLRAWLKRGGCFFLHDAVYPQRLAWLRDIDPKLELKCGGCQYKPRKVVLDHSLVNQPQKLVCGGFWGHLSCPSGTLWQVVFDCPHAASGACGMAVARYGDGVILANSQHQGDTTGLIRNLRANAMLFANRLSIAAPVIDTPSAGRNTFSVEVRNEGHEPRVVELVFNESQTVSATIPPQTSKQLTIHPAILRRGVQRFRLALRCAGKDAVLFDREVRIRNLFEIGSTRYRNLLSPGRRFDRIEFFSTISPIDEQVNGAKVILETVSEGKVVGHEEMPAQVGGFRSRAHIPLDLPPAVYSIKGRLISPAGKVLATDEVQVEILPPTPGLTCIDEDLNFIVDEEPFLPLGLYHVTPAQYDEAMATGINMINQFGWEWSRSITAAFERGCRVVFQPFQFSNQGCVNHYAHNPGLMQWYLLDEPGEADIPKGEALNRDFHRFDKTHPTYLVSCTPSLFDRFGVMADVFAPDPYPHTWDTPEIVARWMDKAYAVCGDRNPLICIPQSHLMETHEEWLAMTHLALCHRSRGIFWYCWSQSGGGTLGVGIRNNSHRKDFPILIGRFRAIAPALLNSTSSDYFVTNGIHGMSCQDPDLGTRYMIVVNPATNGPAATAVVEWRGAAQSNRLARAAFAGRDFPMQKGTVALSLKPLEYGILAVDGPVPSPVLLPPSPPKPTTPGQTRRVGPKEQFKTIQAAIDAASPGDTIVVAPGIYSPIVSSNAYLVIRAEKGADETIIDGATTQRCAQLTACPFGPMGAQTNTVLEGFTLRNGQAGRTRFHRNRGGLAIGGTYRDCHFSNGEAQYGGALAYGLAERCRFTLNHATKCGGALVFSTGLDCRFEDNRCDFDGGAVAFSKLFGCHLSGNQAGRDAGAMYFGNADRSTFLGNRARRNGGAIFTQDGEVRNCLVVSNRAECVAGGAYWSSIRFSTFVDNRAPEAGGFAGLDDNNTVEGCIFWRNSVRGISRGAGTLIDVDPRFETGSFRPSKDSPAVGFAKLTPRGAQERDLAGEKRLKGVATDAGAYEVETATSASKDFPLLILFDCIPLDETERNPIDLSGKWPAGRPVDVLTLSIRFRYAKNPKQAPFGKILSLEMSKGVKIEIGTSPRSSNRLAGQFYGTVSYRQRLDSNGSKWEPKHRTKISPRNQTVQREKWHEIKFTVRANGYGKRISQLLVDGIEAPVDFPWCEEHNEQLFFDCPKLHLSESVEFDRVSISTASEPENP